MRVSVIVSGLGMLALGAAVYFNSTPADLTSVTAYISGFTAYLSPSKAAAPVTPPAIIPVSLSVAKAEDVPILLNAIGTVQAYNTVSVKSRVDGEIIQILFQEGQDVNAGDPLALIDPRPLQAQLSQQQAMRARDQALLDSAIADMKRSDDLVQRNFATAQQAEQRRALVEQYRAQIRSTDAQIAYATTQLGYTRITAPISGRVGIRLLDQGNIVRAAEGTPIVVISQLQPISVIFALSATVIGRTHLTLGKTDLPVTAVAQDDRTELGNGTVELIDNQVDPSTGTIKLKASFPNKPLRLWPGDFVNGRITIDQRRGGITVPSEAVRHGPQGDFVWVVSAENRVSVQNVRVGQSFAGRSLIETGLAAGLRVVTQGYYRLEAGARVEVK